MRHVVLGLVAGALLCSGGCERVEETPAAPPGSNAGPRVECGTTTTFFFNPLPELVIVEVTASDYCPPEDSAVILDGVSPERYPVADMSTVTFPDKLYPGDRLEFEARGEAADEEYYCSVEARVVRVLP